MCSYIEIVLPVRDSWWKNGVTPTPASNNGESPVAVVIEAVVSGQGTVTALLTTALPNTLHFVLCETMNCKLIPSQNFGKLIYQHNLLKWKNSGHYQNHPTFVHYLQHNTQVCKL